MSRDDGASTLEKALRVGLLLVGVAFFPLAAHSQTSLLHIQVQVNRLDGDPISGLRGREFFLSDGRGRLPVTVVQPSMNRARRGGLPAMRVLMIFPSIAGFSDPAAISKVLEEQAPLSFGHAEFAVMRADGSTTAYSSSKGELVASMRAGRTEGGRGVESLRELGAYPGRRAVLYFVGPYQSVPQTVVAMAGKIGALVYEVGSDPRTTSPFSNEPSPEGPPATGGSVTFDPTAEPHVGFAVVSAGYAHLPRETAGGVRMERTLHDAFKAMIQDGRGFYVVTVLISGNKTELTLGLAPGQGYAMEAQPYTLGDLKVPNLSIRTPGRAERQRSANQ